MEEELSNSRITGLIMVTESATQGRRSEPGEKGIPSAGATQKDVVGGENRARGEEVSNESLRRATARRKTGFTVPPGKRGRLGKKEGAADSQAKKRRSYIKREVLS